MISTSTPKKCGTSPRQGEDGDDARKALESRPWDRNRLVYRILWPFKSRSMTAPYQATFTITVLPMISWADVEMHFALVVEGRYVGIVLSKSFRA
jgi:hypothetical protein